jgi:hypothetical protein
MRAKRLVAAWSAVLIVLLLMCSCSAADVGETQPAPRFQTPQLGRNLGVWRLTNDPTVRDHANYHNTRCFSPDGRYLCYTHWGGGGAKGSAAIHLVDLLTGKDRRVDQGVFPRWANQHNWLFYISYKPRREALARNGSCVMWLDVDRNRLSMLVDGPEALGETDFADRWIYGALRFRGRQPEFEEARIPLEPNAKFEKMPGVVGAQRLPNPRHPLFFTRRDHRNDPFQATRFWYDLDGSNQRIAVPTIQQCHMCWLGNGEYMLLGNGLIRGRRWNEPFPSNIHILAAVGLGDVSPCGTRGRYVCGDSILADLRSGDGFQYIEPLSVICFPKAIGDNSGIYDADPKGSPDGTKICFVSNYDLKSSPVTHITRDVRRGDDRIVVEATAGFPESGHINVHREVIAYKRKTPTSFEGITRQALDTAAFNLRAGRVVTSFEARCLSDEQWRRTRPNTAMVRSIGDRNSPLLRQRQTDVYVALVRKPDRPYLRLQRGVLEIIPGEHHQETRGYRLLCDGKPAGEQLLRPGKEFLVGKVGQYTAIAVEWSGLSSEPSLPVPITAIRDHLSGRALVEPPGDFNASTERWADEAKTIRETVHVHDGVIRREWLRDGVVVRRHDLNADGKAIRRIDYKEGKIAVREYHTNQGVRVSREVFAPDGYITETIRYNPGDGREIDHWWFEKGWPVKQVRGDREYVKQGDRFGRFDPKGKFIDTPRGALSD